MFPLSTRFILLIGSLAAGYFAAWFGFYAGELTSWAWSIGNSKDGVWGLFSLILGFGILVAAVCGMFCSLAAVAIALDVARSPKSSEQEIQELYVTGAFACLLLCFVYGVMNTPDVVWYKNKWNLLLVFALTPSVFGAKQLLFNIIFVRVEQPTSDNVHDIRRNSN